MKKKQSKADYFRTKYQNAINNNLTQKAAYYENRLIQMDEPTYKVKGMEVNTKKLGKITQHNIKFEKGSNNFGSETLRIYTF